MNALQLVGELKKLGSKKKALGSARFFKTGKGHYGEGDKFLGVTVPETRNTIKKYQALSYSEISKLLKNNFHEIRLAGLLLLVWQAQKARTLADRKKIFDFYMKHVRYINNWDFVDTSSPDIVGPYLSEISHPKRLAFINKMIASKNLWENRIIMIATLYEIRKGNGKMAIYIAEKFLNHKHDLMHKAVGWMLREVGKRDKRELVVFLDKHASHMPRTALRYAIEHFSPAEKKRYMKMKKVV